MHTEMVSLIQRIQIMNNDRGLHSNIAISGYDYVYTFDASLSTLPDCMLPNENNITNQSYVAVNQLLWIFHRIKVKANLFKSLSSRTKKFKGRFKAVVWNLIFLLLFYQLTVPFLLPLIFIILFIIDFVYTSLHF